MIVLRLDGGLRDAAVEVERMVRAVVEGEAGVEDDAGDDHDGGEDLPAPVYEIRTPTVETVDHGERERDVEGVRMRVAKGEDETRVEQQERGERQIFDSRPIAVRVPASEPEDEQRDGLKNSYNSEKGDEGRQPEMLA